MPNASVETAGLGQRYSEEYAALHRGETKIPFPIDYYYSD
jgi:hypothetical protein